MHTQNKLADILLLAVTLLAAMGWMFTKEVLAAMSPLFFIAIRFLGAGLIIGLMDITAICSLTRRQVRQAFVTGTILGIQCLLWILAVARAENLGVGAFLVSLGFVLIPVVGVLFFSSFCHGYTWVAIVIATAGLALLSLNNGFALSAADSLFLISAVVYAFYFNFNGRYSTAIPAVPLTALQLVAASVVNLCGSLILESFPTAAAFSVLEWILASIFIATSLRFFLLVKAQSIASPAHAALIMTLEPVWVALLGAAWFAEVMSLQQLLGCLLIFGSLLLHAYGGVLRRRRLRKKETG